MRFVTHSFLENEVKLLLKCKKCSMPIHICIDHTIKQSIETPQNYPQTSMAEASETGGPVPTESPGPLAISSVEARGPVL